MRRKSAIARGTSRRANPSEQATATLRASAPRPVLNSSTSVVDSVSVRRAWASSREPASVSVIPRGCRANSGTPMPDSSLATCLLIAEGATFSACAASVTDPVRATSRK